MSNQALKAVVENKPAAAKKQDLAHLLTSPATLAQIKAALPRHMTAERMARIALTEMRKTPKLAQCDARTFIGAVIQLSQLGLEPGGILGHAYLIPFENRKKGTTDVQIIIGYRGMIDLARRSGQIASLNAVVAREGDQFDVQLGLDAVLRHVPAFDDERPLVYVYAVAIFKDGGRQFEVMTRAQVERVRNASQGYKRAISKNEEHPWTTHFEEMAKKTVIRRLFKYLPVSIELQTAVALDEHGDAGLSQMVDDLGAIDSTSTEIEETKALTNQSGEQPTLALVLTRIAEAESADELDVVRDLARGLTDGREIAEADVALKARASALEAK